MMRKKRAKIILVATVAVFLLAGFMPFEKFTQANTAYESIDGYQNLYGAASLYLGNYLVGSFRYRYTSTQTVTFGIFAYNSTDTYLYIIDPRSVEPMAAANNECKPGQYGK